MVSLYDQLISEIMLSEPHLSPGRISDEITFLIQNEILPEVLTRIRLPRLPSPVSIKREELMELRYGKAHGRLLKENVKFIQDLEKLRFRFDSSDLTSEDFFFTLMNSTQSPFHLEVKRDVEPDGKALPVEPDIIRERLKSSTSIERPRQIIRRPARLMSFDSSIQEKIARNPAFERLVGEIESKIRRNYDHEIMEVYFNFKIRVDKDDPDGEKTIINVSLPTHSFDEKMEFWEKIEADLRGVINELDVTEPERRAINRSLFTHVQPT